MANGEDSTRPLARILDPSQFRRRRAFDEKLRARIEAAVEQLIAALDATEDTDQDTQADDNPIDDDEREPSLGFLETRNQTKIGNGGSDELERDDADHEVCASEAEGDPLDDGELDRGDDEPSLGWTVDGVATVADPLYVDAEQGNLPVAELDHLRADHRARRHARRHAGDGESAYVRDPMISDGAAQARHLLKRIGRHPPPRH